LMLVVCSDGVVDVVGTAVLEAVSEVAVLLGLSPGSISIEFAVIDANPRAIGAVISRKFREKDSKALSPIMRLSATAFKIPSTLTIADMIARKNRTADEIDCKLEMNPSGGVI
jgi:hypothetical protein